MYTADQINATIARVETAKQNHPVGWGSLKEFGLPSDEFVNYAFITADVHATRLAEEDKRVVYATGWLQGVMIGIALGESKS